MSFKSISAGLEINFSRCKSCRERYSTGQVHKIIRDDRSLALNCDFVNRASVSKVFIPEANGVPAHHAHSDGVGRDSIHNTAAGHFVYLAPGQSNNLYKTCAADSPARYVPMPSFEGRITSESFFRGRKGAECFSISLLSQLPLPDVRADRGILPIDLRNTTTFGTWLTENVVLHWHQKVSKLPIYAEESHERPLMAFSFLVNMAIATRPFLHPDYFKGLR